MENIKKSWVHIFEKYDKEFDKNTISQILSKIANLLKEYKPDSETAIFPKQEDIFKCFNYFEVKFRKFDPQKIFLNINKYKKMTELRLQT